MPAALPPLVVLLGLGFALLLALLIAMTAWRLTHPPRRSYASAVSRGEPGDPSELDTPLDCEQWTVTSRSETFDVWDIAGLDPAGPTIILAHGWGDSRMGALTRAEHLAPHCGRMVAFDMPAQGERGGWLRMGAREHHDVLAIARKVRETSTAPIVLLGWSLGAGVCIAAAAADDDEDRLIAGVVAEAAYRHVHTPARNVLHYSGMPWRLNLAPALWLVGTLAGVGPTWRGFDRRRLAARLRVPLLVLHGIDDPISPIEDARAIAKAAPHATLAEIAEAEHNDLWLDPYAERSTAAVAEFLGRLHAAD